MKNAMLIANTLKLSRSTVIKYLKNGSKIGLCDYNTKEEMKKSALANACNNQKLKCTFPNSETKYFNSIAKLLKHFNISKRAYEKIMANDGIIDINIFPHKKSKEKLLKYNMSKIELL